MIPVASTTLNGVVERFTQNGLLHPAFAQNFFVLFDIFSQHTLNRVSQEED